MTRSWMQFSAVDSSASAEAHAAYLERMVRLVEPMRKRAIEKLGLAPGATVLDAGCGLGEVAIQLVERVAPGGRVVGIDASGLMIERARAAAEAAGADVEFSVASVTSLPFADDTFDAARSERVFQHLSAEERQAAAAELVRVVRPGGIIQLADPDHAQWAVAATDRELAHHLTEFVMVHARTPEAGLLNGGLLRAAGVVDVETEVGPIVHDDAAQLFAAWALEGALDQLIERGLVTPERAKAFLADLEARERDGVFLATGVGYLTTARVPG